MSLQALRRAAHAAEIKAPRMLSKVARGFHSSSSRHFECGEMKRVIDLLEKQTDELRRINERLSALEASLQKKTNASPQTERSHVRAFTPKNITIHGHSFEVSRIKEVYYRHSILWLSDPFVIILEYQNRHVELLVGGEFAKVPVISDYEYHKFGAKDEQSAKALVRDIKAQCPHLA